MGNRSVADYNDANELIEFFIKAGFNVIERSQLNRILTEQKLSLSGLLEKQDYYKLGKVTNLDAIVIVNSGGLNDYTIIKLIDIETRTVIVTQKVPINRWSGRYSEEFFKDLANKVLYK